MKAAVIAYVSSAFAMLALDIVWLGFAASRLYRPRIGHLMLEGFNPAPAIIFYLVYVAGVVVLAVLPALAEQRLGGAAWRGAVLGFVAYATYDLTNQATLRGWSTTVTIADLCWGTFLTTVAATAGYWVTMRLAPRIG